MKTYSKEYSILRVDYQQMDIHHFIPEVAPEILLWNERIKK